MDTQTPQAPGWGPPITPPIPPHKESFWHRTRVVWVVLGIFFGGIILLATMVVDGNQATTSSTPAVTALPANTFPGTATPMTTPDTTPTFDPQPSDITVKVKIVSKDNFGDAGSVITYEPDVTLDSSAFDPDVTYQVTYEVRGGQDGPEIHSFTVAGDSYTYDQEVTQTASTNQRLTARVTSVDATS
jgi:hypothetical protein